MLFWVLGIVVFVLLLLFFWLKVGGGVLFWLSGETNSGLKLSSRNNLFQYLIKLEKTEKAPFLVLVNFNSNVPRDVTIYRRLEPVSNSPKVIGCSWKKNFVFWKLDIFVDKSFLNQVDTKSVNNTIDGCFSRLFNSKVTDLDRIQQLEDSSINTLESINSGIIFEK